MSVALVHVPEVTQEGSSLYQQRLWLHETISNKKPTMINLLPTENLSVAFCKTGDDISLGKRKHALSRLCVNPFLSVSWCNLTKLTGVRQNGEVGSVRELGIVSGGSEIFQSSRLGKRIELAEGNREQ